MSFEELYPVDDLEGPIIANSHYFTVVKYDELEIKDTSDDKVIIDKFDKHFKQITEQRIKSLRITVTPNNKDSSRGHLFVKVTFYFDTIVANNGIQSGGGNINSGTLTLIDMAGSENTIEIKKLFL